MFSTKPFKSLLDLIKAFPDEQSCIDHLEFLRWNGNIVSPFDAESKVYKAKDNRYKCTNTNKYFNVKTGTIFENSKIKLKTWFMAIYLFATHKNGISSYQLATDLDITQKTAWFMLSRLRYAFEHSAFLSKMDGLIQVDETFVGGKNKNRHHDKKVEQSQGRSFKDKTPVLGMIDDKGKVKCVAVADTKMATIQPIVRNTVSEGSIVVTDEWMAYNGLNDKYHHEVVDHGRKQYVNDSGFTSNKMESFWSNFKRTLNGTYIKVSRKHLQRYCNEVTFRFNTRLLTVQERFDMALGNVAARLTYKQLTIKNQLRYLQP